MTPLPSSPPTSRTSPLPYALAIVAGIASTLLVFRAGESLAQDASTIAAPLYDAAPFAMVHADAPLVALAEPAALAPEPTLAEQLAEALRLLEAYRSAGDATAKRLGLWLLIAGLAQLLIYLLRAATPLGDRWKRWVPVVALGLGVAVGLFSSLGAGAATLTAILYGAGPPLATFAHELFKLFRAPAAT